MASNSMHQKSMRFLALQAQYNQRVYTCRVSFAMPNRIFKVIYSYLVQRQTHHCTQRTPWDYRKAVLLTVKWEVQGKAMWICTLTLLSQIPSLAVPTRCNLRGCTFKCWSATRRNESNTARTLRPSELSKQNHKCYSKLGLRTQYPGF